MRVAGGVVSLWGGWGTVMTHTSGPASTFYGLSSHVQRRAERTEHGGERLRGTGGRVGVVFCPDPRRESWLQRADG